MQQRKRSPLVSSVDVLTGLAAGIMVLSLAGMTVYAGDHLRNTAATAAPRTATTTTSTTGRLQLSRPVTTTTTRPVTTTHHS
jgi:hypothetical protein